jgi:ketosteroid isomerase-like protein
MKLDTRVAAATVAPSRAAGTARLIVALSVVALSFAACAQAPEGERANAENVAAARSVLDAQVEAWNRGDIGGFMDGYERAETTTFVSGDSITRGWQTVLDRYKARYDTREKMGRLEFSELEIKPLSPFYAHAVGRWKLTRASDAPAGRFSLLLRRTDKGWRVVHDHTS